MHLNHSKVSNQSQLVLLESFTIHTYIYIYMIKKWWHEFQLRIFYHVYAGGWFTVRAFLCFFWPMGWVGVGWGGLITFNGTSTHIWCYTSNLVSCTCTHTWCYATDLVSCTCTHTWCYATDLVSCTCTCTHTWCYATDLVSCTCTHTWCYATDGLGWGGVG